MVLRTLFRVLVTLPLLLWACSSDSPADSRNQSHETSTPPDSSACSGPTRTDLPPSGGGAWATRQFQTLDQHAAESETVLLGTVVSRRLTAEPAPKYDETGPGANTGAPSWLGCVAYYEMDASRVLKTVEEGQLPNPMTVGFYEAEAHPDEGYVIQIAQPLELGAQIVVFLERGGETDIYFPTARPALIEGDAVLLGATYSEEPDRVALSDLVARLDQTR